MKYLMFSVCALQESIYFDSLLSFSVIHHYLTEEAMETSCEQAYNLQLLYFIRKWMLDEGLFLQP